MKNALSKRDRDALGSEYRGYARQAPVPGEALARTMPHQPWVPMPDLRWQPRRPGADDAMAVPHRGLPT